MIQKHQNGKPISLLVFSASLRNDSMNTKLARLAAEIISKKGGKVDFANMSEFDSPSYNQDLESEGFYPAGAEQLRKSLLANDGFIIASPEYNGSMPGNLKNIIDWVSRFRPQPFNGRHALLMSASPSMAGANKGLWSLRMPLEHLGARVFPDMFSLAMAHQAFTSDFKLNNPGLVRRFEDNITDFMGLVEAAKNYPCVKKSWIEFLGETPDPSLEKVDYA